ncbi:MAG TPA: DegQ family serine endoprotease [Verrucomicrobiae bacterium]
MNNTIYSDYNRQRLSRFRAIVLALLLAGGAGAFTWNQLQAKDSSRPAPVKLSVSEKPVTRETGITSFAPVVKKVTPSVVKVYVSATVKQTSHQIPDEFSNNPFFRRFFGEDPGGQQFGRNMPMPKQHGMGSGVIVTKDGYLLTNNHVVDNADEVKVALGDGREFSAKVVGKDPQSDIAVLKIDGKDLPAIELADSDKLEVGDVVLAIGNPFGVGQTVTSGIVSAMGRGSLGLDYEDMIQTDAAINPGNSGGALIDAEGRLIGINTAILSRSGGNQGIGFAVPVNLARSVMEGLVKDGRVVRGFMGVNIQDLTPTLAKEFGVKESSGALIAAVSPKSPAEKAGLRDGDIITEFNGKAVQDSRHLKLQVAQTTPGTAVSVKVLRDGKTKSFDVTVKELPGNELASRKNSEAAEDATDALHGVAVGDIDAATKQQLKLPANLNGAVITQVDPNSPAYESGLREGDVILEINRKPVKSAEDAVQLTENVKDKRTLLRVWSKGGSRYVVVDENKG